MPSCSVPGCTSGRSGSSEKVQAFKFPIDDVMKKKWMKLIGIKSIRHGAVVCKKHFSSGYILARSEDVIQGRARDLPILRSDAVPTVFDFGPTKKNRRKSSEPPKTTVSPCEKPKLNHSDHAYDYRTVDEPAAVTSNQR